MNAQLRFAGPKRAKLRILSAGARLIGAVAFAVALFGSSPSGAQEPRPGSALAGSDAAAARRLAGPDLGGDASGGRSAGVGAGLGALRPRRAAAGGRVRAAADAAGLGQPQRDGAPGRRLILGPRALGGPQGHCLSEDVLSPPPLVKMAADPIPHARYVEVSTGGHSVYWELPDEFNRVLEELLAEAYG